MPLSIHQIAAANDHAPCGWRVSETVGGEPDHVFEGGLIDPTREWVKESMGGESHREKGRRAHLVFGKGFIDLLPSERPARRPQG